METRNIKDDTTSTEFLRLFEASQFVKCRWNLLESDSRWIQLPPCVNHPPWKKESKKTNKPKQKRAETNIQPLLDKSRRATALYPPTQTHFWLVMQLSLTNVQSWERKAWRHLQNVCARGYSVALWWILSSMTRHCLIYSCKCCHLHW